MNLEMDETLKILSYNAGNIISDKDYDNKRWTEVFLEIIEKNPDVVVLHEINSNSKYIFDKLFDYGYLSTEESLYEKNYGNERDDWEIVYSKYPIKKLYYVPISRTEGLSHFEINFGGKKTYKGYDTLVIIATTWNPMDLNSLNRKTISLEECINKNRPTLVSFSINNLGSKLYPTKGFFDVWTRLGSAKETESTINSNLKHIITKDCQRADHIWSNCLIPKSLDIVKVKNGGQHDGLYIVFFNEKKLNTKDEPAGGGPRKNKPCKNKGCFII